MKRYIDAEPIEKFIENGLNRKENPLGWQAIEILAEVHYAQTVDVEPVKHGYWIEVQKHNGRKTIQCSECKRVLNVDDIQPEYLGCPMCRAKMDKE